MLFDIAGILFGSSISLFFFWNLTVMWQASRMDREERKTFMNNKKDIERKSRILKPARLMGYGCLIAGILFFLSGHLF